MKTKSALDIMQGIVAGTITDTEIATWTESFENRRDVIGYDATYGSEGIRKARSVLMSHVDVTAYYDEKVKRERPAHVYHDPRHDLRDAPKGKCHCGRSGHWVTGAGEYLCTRHEDDY